MRFDTAILFSLVSVFALRPLMYHWLHVERVSRGFNLPSLICASIRSAAVVIAEQLHGSLEGQNNTEGKKTLIEQG